LDPTYFERECIRQFIYERHTGPLSKNANYLSDVIMEKSVASACQLPKDPISMDIHDGIQHGVHGGDIVGSL
jgi:hypothetical protein